MTLFLITLLIVGGLVAFAMLSGGNHKTDKEDTQSDDEVLANAVGFLTKTEALRQAEVAGNDIVKDAILSNTYTGPWPERRTDGGWLSIFDNLRILKVAGMNFRQGMNRYKGFIDAALVPEPKNEYDSNAIKVVAIAMFVIISVILMLDFDVLSFSFCRSTARNLDLSIAIATNLYKT